MTDKKPPLTDYQKTVYTPEEQEILELGAHIIRYEEFTNDLRRAIGQPPLTEEELDILIEQAKNRS